MSTEESKMRELLREEVFEALQDGKSLSFDDSAKGLDECGKSYEEKGKCTKKYCEENQKSSKHNKLCFSCQFIQRDEREIFN